MTDPEFIPPNLPALSQITKPGSPALVPVVVAITRYERFKQHYESTARTFRQYDEERRQKQHQLQSPPEREEERLEPHQVTQTRDRLEKLNLRSGADLASTQTAFSLAAKSFDRVATAIREARRGIRGMNNADRRTLNELRISIDSGRIQIEGGLATFNAHSLALQPAPLRRHYALRTLLEGQHAEPMPHDARQRIAVARAARPPRRDDHPLPEQPDAPSQDTSRTVTPTGHRRPPSR
jgi:hypothetical protein